MYVPGQKEQISDLTAGMAAVPALLKNVRKSLESLEKQGPLAVPLPKRIQDRHIRKAGYENAVQSLSKWDDLVYVRTLLCILVF